MISMNLKPYLLAIMAVILLFGCVSNQEQTKNDKIIVAVTIVPQAEFLEKIGGDKVEIVLMVPPGASPHTYEPTPQQLEGMNNAVMYAQVGSGVEFELAWMDDLASLNENMLIVDCSNGIELIETEEHNEHESEDGHLHGGTDPHIWTSPENVKIMVENIYNGLVEVDPENSEYYEQNKDTYLKELEVLNRNIIASFEGKQNRKFIVYHPAWAYFADEYGLEQVPIEEEGKEPTPTGIANVITLAKENNITVVFASPEYSIASAETIANEIDGKVLLISPLEKSYIENLQNVADAFAKHAN